jgi:hypothetical protein
MIATTRYSVNNTTRADTPGAHSYVLAPRSIRTRRTRDTTAITPVMNS